MLKSTLIYLCVYINFTIIELDGLELRAGIWFLECKIQDSNKYINKYINFFIFSKIVSKILFEFQKEILKTKFEKKI